MNNININLNEIADAHFDWVERMGWHNKTVLEALALIASEVGEAAEESFVPTCHFGEELADIILRISDLANTTKVDLNSGVLGAVVEWRSTNLQFCMLELLVEVANWINTARYATLDDSFSSGMCKVVRRVIHIADLNDIDLLGHITRKMEINEQRGTRGRLV